MKNNPYFEKPGLSSGQLAKYWNRGNYSPDMALIETTPKAIFTTGHAFEALCYDLSHPGSETFFADFFISEQTGNLPDCIARVIEEKPIEKQAEALEKLIKLTKAGVPNKTHKTRHAYIDECLANPGKMPVSNTDYGMLLDLAKKMQVVPLPPDHLLTGWTVGDVMEKAEWQVPIYWEAPMPKKALIDCLLRFKDVSFIFDLKWTSGFSQIVKSIGSRLWIQDVHYQEAVSMKFGVPCEPMTFIVGSGEEPGLCQIYRTNQENRSLLIREYENLCQSYQAWLDAGRPPKGYLEAREVKVWLGLK